MSPINSFTNLSSKNYSLSWWQEKGLLQKLKLTLLRLNKIDLWHIHEKQSSYEGYLSTTGVIHHEEIFKAYSDLGDSKVQAHIDDDNQKEKIECYHHQKRLNSQSPAWESVMHLLKAKTGLLRSSTLIRLQIEVEKKNRPGNSECGSQPNLTCGWQLLVDLQCLSMWKWETEEE